MMRPWCSSATWSHRSASSMYAVVTNTVVPSATISCRMSHRSRRLIGSTPKVGSSRSRILRVVHQRATQRQLLLHSARQLPREALLERPEIREVVQPLQALGALGLGHRVEVGVELDVLAHREVVIEPEALRHVGDVLLHALGVPRHAHARHQRVARRGRQHARQHAERGGLARAVGPHQAEQRAGRHLERERVHRHQVAELPRQTLDRDSRTLHCLLPTPNCTSAGMPGLRS